MFLVSGQASGRCPHRLFVLSKRITQLQVFQGRDHSITKGYLRESGVPFTALRNNLYMDLVPYMFDATGVLREPARTGRTNGISRRDTAEVAATLLSNPARESGALVLAGPESLTMGKTAERFSRLTGKQLRYEDETIEEGGEWRRSLPDGTTYTSIRPTLRCALRTMWAKSNQVVASSGRVSKLLMNRSFYSSIGWAARK